ncbi:MAG: GNAT family N-acetyltransferase [Acidobacteriota bacterium]|nr:MAG: GNAT family N-acetyltransferase [Acidobacteriota bacterium]
MSDNIEIRECESLDQLGSCVELQRAVFALPETEISPVRHFIVTKNAGGFTLGAYLGERLVGFVLSVPAFLRGEPAFYSHMTAVDNEFQSLGLGRRLKWAQRERALSEGVKYVKWTFEPVKARNAYFNLEKLGAIVSEYRENFYGIDYGTSPETDGEKIGLASDRLFAEWHLESDKVIALSRGEKFENPGSPAAAIVIMNDWNALVAADPKSALAEQMRIRAEFQEAFEAGFIGRGFHRDRERPAYLLYRG